MKDQWDKRYSDSEYVYGKQANQFLSEHLEDIPRGHILSLAEGEGRNAVFLAKNGRQVTAIDSSSVGLEKANRLAEENSVSIKTVCADLAHYHIADNSYDGIISIFCHLPADARKFLYSQLSSAIKPGGIFLLEAYTPAQIGKGTGGPPLVEFTVEWREMKTYLHDFDILHAEELDRDVVEGKLHTGIGSVLQIIAKRR